MQKTGPPVPVTLSLAVVFTLGYARLTSKRYWNTWSVPCTNGHFRPWLRQLFFFTDGKGSSRFSPSKTLSFVSSVGVSWFALKATPISTVVPRLNMQGSLEHGLTTTPRTLPRFPSVDAAQQKRPFTSSASLRNGDKHGQTISQPAFPLSWYRRLRLFSSITPYQQMSARTLSNLFLLLDYRHSVTRSPGDLDPHAACQRGWRKSATST